MQTIDVTGLPPATVRAVESLVTVLRSQAGSTGVGQPSEGPPALPPRVERLLDTDFHAECEADTSPEVSLAEVRAGLASIPGDLTADFAAEREDR
jgi:hypothetical protein